jgi:hypothetical protein
MSDKPQELLQAKTLAKTVLDKKLQSQQGPQPQHHFKPE